MIMNKKFTLFAASLLFSSAFSVYAAQDVKPEEMKLSHYSTDASASKDDVKAGGTFFLKFGEDYLGSDWSNDDKTDVDYFVAKKDEAKLTEGKDDLNKYLWVVTPENQPGQKIAYSFQNVETQQLIRFTVDASDVFTIVTVAPESGASIENLFEVGQEGEAYAGAATQFTVAGYDSNDILSYETGLVAQAFPVGEGMPVADNITIVDLKDGISVDVADLNDLYNSAGFNFALNGDKLADVSNIFNDKKVLALNVKGSSATIDGVVYTFPAGTYFVTATPWTLTEDEIKNGLGNDYYDFLTRCTFIAIDSDDNILDDADEQKKGNGFTLTEVSGKDLVTYEENEDGTVDNDMLSKGNQIAVANACFAVLESTTSEGIYELTVKGARVVEASTADKQIEKDLKLTAGAKISEVYTTSAEGNQYIFKFSESSVVKPIDLLHKGDTATIVNIRFYKANGADNSYDEKYLTTDATASKYVAKGNVLADVDAPAYQWVISAADAENNVTFTNRETGMTLKTKLFDEGNGLYSLAPATTNAYFQYYLLTKEGNVTVADKDGNLSTESNNATHIALKNIKIELIEAKAVNHAGYLNVDNETLMTLSFGRDIAPTSNKLYPVYDEKNDDFADELSGDVADAAQWQLIKSTSNHPVNYNYVYANGSLINTKNNGDAVYAYTYNLQLVNDGKVLDKFLKVDDTNAADIVDNINAATDFYIQENVDGSVLLKKYTSGKRTQSQAVLIEDYTKLSDEQNEGTTIKDLKENSFKLQDIKVESKADYVKTYLIAEAPAVSLPAVEGHYSFVSELGNYITMNEERDGLTVKEESEPMYLYVTDEEEVVPSFYITKGVSPIEGQRMYLFNPTDSVDYYVATGTYDKKYQWTDNITKAIFKSAAISESRDTLTTEIKGESTLVAQKASNAEKVEGGLDMFKMQIIEDPESDGLYVVRNVADKSQYLYSWNGMLAWGDKDAAMKFDITGAEAPTANESVSATEVKVVAYDGAINIKNAAGKNVVISTILGQIVANEVLTSDNATISVPAGIAIVSVDGEEAVKVSVK